MFYFAYGSNLDLLQMQLRCPDAQFVSTARLDGYRICFPRKSFVRDCAVISIEPEAGEQVWGALYELDPADLKRLDEREGFDPKRERCAEPAQPHHASGSKLPTSGRSWPRPTSRCRPRNPGLPSPHYIGYLVAVRRRVRTAEVASRQARAAHAAAAESRGVGPRSSAGFDRRRDRCDKITKGNGVSLQPPSGLIDSYRDRSRWESARNPPRPAGFVLGRTEGS